MKELRDLQKVFINLEPEGQGVGIVMRVTQLQLVGPFYYIHTHYTLSVAIKVVQLFVPRRGFCQLCAPRRTVRAS